MTFDKPVIVLPYYGEFGFFMFYYVRWVNLIEAPQKIVCCNKGEEIFFPSASSFFYDWENPLADHAKKGYRDYDNPSKLKLIELLSKRYPNYDIIDLTKDPFNRFEHEGKYIYDLKSVFEIKPKKLMGLKCDIVLGARKRPRSSYKNWPHWDTLGEMLKADGLSYAVVGKEETTRKVKGAEVYSWEHPSPDSIVELLQSSKLFVGSCTGTSHLAAFLQVPMIIIRHPKSLGVFVRNMKITNANDVTYLAAPPLGNYPLDYWENPTVFYNAIIKQINRP